MRTLLLTFGSSAAVFWTFGAYEIVRSCNAAKFRLRTAFLSRWATPSCVTCAVAVFAGVILLRN